MDKFLVKICDRERLSGSNNSSSSSCTLGSDSAITQRSENNEVQGDYESSPSLLKQPESDSCDPVHPIPANRIERDVRIKKGPYQPKLCFPLSKIGQKNRAFQCNWYENHKWLEYSVGLDSAFCFYCRFFASNDTGMKGHLDAAFINKGFKKWNKAKEYFHAHEKSKGHQHSLMAWSNSQKNKPIDVLLDDSRAVFLSNQEKTRIKNREIMNRLIDIVLCLAKGGRPFRGHTEHDQSTHARGLFLDLVDLVSKYDPVLKEHLTNAKNCTYTSHFIQNDIITSVKNVLVRKIKNKLRNKYVSIIADDTSDCGHNEQMSLVIRVFDNDATKPVEYCVALRRLLSTDAQSIFKEVEITLSELEIVWENVLAVCFDGASTMSGSISGVQMKCKEKNSSILYVHCYAHCLNLVLVDSCKTECSNIVADFFGIMQFLYSFMEGNHATTRHAILEKACKELGLTLRTLKSLSTTRWACRGEAVSVVKNNFPAIVKALVEITTTSKDSEQRAKGRGLLIQMQSFEFIFCLVMMQPILQMIAKVSKQLQSPDLNLIAAIASTSTLQSALSGMRSSEEMNKFYNETVKICEEEDIEIPQVKKRKVSRYLDDVPRTQYVYETKEEEMRVRCFYPFIDCLISGINRRYGQETVEAISAMANLMTLSASNEDVTLLAKLFRLSHDDLSVELRLLKGDSTTPKGTSCSSKILNDWIQWMTAFDRLKLYSSFYSALKSFSTIPVTSCSCERAFSKLTIVKNKLRTTQTQGRLESLLLLSVEHEIVSSISADEVIDEFKNIVPFQRRLLL